VFKIKLRHLFIIALFLLVLVSVNGCSKAQCKVNSECSNLPGKTVTCVDKICQYKVIPNFCGNGIKDAIEDGKPGNSCTCEADYGKCEGKGQLTQGSRTYDAKYVEKFCNERKQCVFGVPKEKTRPLQLVDKRNTGFFDLEIITSLKEPMQIKKDTINFEITLTDMRDNVILPINIKKLIIKGDDVLFGQIETANSLVAIGDKTRINVPITYVPEQIEETHGLTYELSYEFKERIRGERLSNGTYTYTNEIKRDDFQSKFRQKIILVKTE